MDGLPPAPPHPPYLVGPEPPNLGICPDGRGGGNRTRDLLLHRFRAARPLRPACGASTARGRAQPPPPPPHAEGRPLSARGFPVPPTGCNENEADPLDRDQQPYPPSQKTKRMRTSFKHHQLRTMKSYFAINHNPDAKDLKQLAQKTGLTKRVLQVSWGLGWGWGICRCQDLGQNHTAGYGPWEDVLPKPAFLFCLPSPFSFSISSVCLYSYFSLFFLTLHLFSPSIFVFQIFSVFFMCVYPSVLFVSTLSLFSFL